MNAGEQAAFAPFGFVGVIGGETSAEDGALRFEAEESGCRFLACRAARECGLSPLRWSGRCETSSLWLETRSLLRGGRGAIRFRVTRIRILRAEKLRRKFFACSVATQKYLPFTSARPARRSGCEFREKLRPLRDSCAIDAGAAGVDSWAADSGSAIKREKRVVQFVGVAHVGPGFRAHFGDGSGIKAADLGENGFGQHAAHFDSAGAALFEGSIIKIGVRIGVENFVRELRRAPACQRRRSEFDPARWREDMLSGRRYPSLR